MPILIKPNGEEIEVNGHMMKCHKDGLLKGYKLPSEGESKLKKLSTKKEPK